MKKLILACTVLGLLISGTAQQIDTQKDQCNHCNMLIRDAQFAALAIDSEKTHKFDAIECLVNFLKARDEAEFTRLLVADYSAQGLLVDAKQATYLKSKAIASPMGAYLSAYESAEVAKKILNEKGGEIMNWSELNERFKDSSFGLLSHPTHHHNRPDAYAPIGIMGDHLHHKGGFMVSLRYMNMNMDGNIQGSSDISNMGIYQNYMVAPQSMEMSMIMFGVMYAPSDKLTIMIMQNFLKNDMNLRSMAGMNFTTKSSGVGDLKVSALYGIVNRENSSFHLNGAISIPVGDIENRDDTPMMENMKLPYPMQLGSGTTDFTIGGTYKGASSNLSWGFQQLNTFRFGDNSQGYQFGNQLEGNAWTSYKLASWISLSIRLQGIKLSEIDGVDSELNPMMVPLANTNNSGYSRIRSYLGTNISFGEREFFRDFKIGLEYGLPLLQEVDGVQMNEDRTVTAGLRYSI